MRTRKQWAKSARRRLVANAGDAQVCWMLSGESWHARVALYVNTHRHEVRIPRSFRHTLKEKANG
jgi:hypothetical protein